MTLKYLILNSLGQSTQHGPTLVMHEDLQEVTTL